jgi:hypothetical protein
VTRPDWLRRLLRRLNLFDPSRTNEIEQGNVSGPTVPRDTNSGF